jgi:hypothetical protein
MRHPFRHLWAVAAVVATLAIGATRARADVAPPDTCTAPGQSCTNAGPQFNQAGTCVATTCTRQVPSPDGGTTSMTYDCNRCTAGGTGGSGGAGAGGAGGSTSPSSKSSGCAVAPEHGDGGSLGVPISLIAGLMLLAARRRNAVG